MGRRVLIAFVEMMLEKEKMSNVLEEKYKQINLLRAEINLYCDSTNLRGYSYSNSKNYFLNVCLPALRQFEECCKVFEECADTIKIKYVECFGLVHTLPTDTDKLEEMLADLESELASLKAERDSCQLDIYNGNIDTNNNTLALYMASYESLCSNIVAIENRINKIKEFISKMHEFDSSACQIFGRFIAEYDKVKNLAMRLKAERGGRSIFGCCERSHWTVSNSLKQDIVDMQMSLLLKLNGHINWSEAKKMMGAGDDVSAMVLPFLLSQYDLPADTSYDDFLLYLSAYDPDVINKYFSKVYNDGEIDYDYIAELMWRDPSKVSDAQQAMLIAAFVSMSDDEKERFVEVSYTYYFNKDAHINYRQDMVTVNCQLSPIFESMTEKYGALIVSDDNFNILASGKDEKDANELELYRTTRENYQNYNIMYAFCNKNAISDVVFFDRIDFNNGDLYRDIFTLDVNINDLEVSSDSLDKVVSVSVNWTEKTGEKNAVLGSESCVVAYRIELGEMRGIYVDTIPNNKGEKIIGVLASEALSQVGYKKIGLIYGLVKDANDIYEIATGTDAEMKMKDKMTQIGDYFDALSYCGIEGQAIIDVETGQICFNTPYVDEETMYGNLNYWANNDNEELEDLQKEYIIAALNASNDGDMESNDVWEMLEDDTVKDSLVQYIYNRYFN